jgi:hypothetical protein
VCCSWGTLIKVSVYCFVLCIQVSGFERFIFLFYFFATPHKFEIFSYLLYVNCQFYPFLYILSNFAHFLSFLSISIHCVQLCRYVHFVCYKSIVKSCILFITSQLVVVLLSLKFVFCESLVFVLYFVYCLLFTILCPFGTRKSIRLKKPFLKKYFAKLKVDSTKTFNKRSFQG